MTYTLSLPAKLPAIFVPNPGSAITPTVDTGGYDVAVGGFGFRLATDLNSPFVRGTEQTTVRRFDNSDEPGEQSLAQVPWVKAQSSFHAGAGQLNLEQGFTAFQYQQEQVEHVRYDTSVGIDPWTPGKAKRLPSTLLTGVSGRDFSKMVTAAVGGFDYAICGGAQTLSQLKWVTGADAAPTITDVDLTGATFGGASNVTVTSLVTDGSTYYALLQLAIAGSTALVRTLIVKGSVSSAAAPTVIYKSGADNVQHLGVLGWQKARLVAGIDQSLYELSPSPVSPPVDLTTLTPKYTHPSTGWTWVDFAESPTAIIGAGQVNQTPTLLGFELDSSGAVPTLTGGAALGGLPPGEVVYSLTSFLGSFLAIGTAYGVRICSFDTYTGKIKIGPRSVESTAPVYDMIGRDRFIYAGWTNQQADGKTGLACVDLSYEVDSAGRNAYAPSLRPGASATTGLGTVKAVNLLPLSNRLLFVATDGVFVEKSAADVNDPAWLRSSRIRYGTTEKKLFKLGKVTGTLDSSQITITGYTPMNAAYALGTFGFVTAADPPEFGLPADSPYEWLQLRFDLVGVGCEMNSWQVKAHPAPNAPEVITFTVNCFRNEADRFGQETSDPSDPRTRYANVLALKQFGGEVSFVEFTNSGSIKTKVVIDQLEFRSYSRPNIEDDFGGYITFRLRATES